ncbi:MAG: hypothetical protein Q4F41_10665 [Eubacteriales bacterium]|nr:hypothetical protein [Eubacteriales bacterium]
MRKKLAVAAVMMSLSAVGAIPAFAEEALTEGIYELQGDPEISMQCFIRFNEDGTYYGSFFDKGVVEAGTYEVLEEELEYYSAPGEDGNYEETADNETATASQVIALTSYKDGSVQKCAFVDDQLVDITLGGMSTHKTLTHNPDYAYDPENDELPIVVQVYYANEEEGSSLTLYHDKTFVDYTGDVGLEGTWEETEEGSYTLTDEDEKEYTLVVNEDGTAAYTQDETTTTLKDSVGEAELLTFAAEDIEVGLPMGVDMQIVCAEDGTCQAIVLVEEVGAEMVVDEGTYTVTEIFNYTFNFETAGEIAGEADFASATATSIEVNVPYKADVTGDFQGNETPMTIDTVLNGTITMG